MATSNRNVTVTKDEYALFGKALPYIAMLIGAALLFLTAVLTRVGIWAQDRWGDTSAYDSTQVATWFVLLSTVILCAVSWKLFGQRKGPFIRQHATITVFLGHAWLIFALWEDLGDWTFGLPTVFAYFFGAGCIALSWSIRRWAFRAAEMGEDSEGSNPFEEMGLGNSRIDKQNSRPVSGGMKFRLKLALGKTVENAKDARVKIAQLAGVPRNLVHISETDSGVEGLVDIFIQDEDPFGHKIVWAGPDMAGQSISQPVTFGTYDNGFRPQVYLAGKDGGSSQHFITMGMPGAGKSKAWQVIYGTVLTRRNVSVIFGDPAKGMQTGAPLAEGLEWFATTQADCEKQIAAVMRAIPARTDYLTSRGLSHWQDDCGLNFIIFHLEEAARFADTDDLIQAVEAARSAGICIVLSLQRATGDRMKTSTRYNLGGSMCFGVRDKRDAALALTEYTIKSGAEPHRLQDRYPGRLYLEALGIDSRMFAHEIQTDWVNERHLERIVDEGKQYRTPIDNVTADALGPAYLDYRDKVDRGQADWQQLRINRYAPGQEQPTNDIPTVEDNKAIEGSIVENDSPNPRNNLGVSSEERRRYELELWSAVMNFAENGQETFSTGDLANVFKGRQKSWISKRLKDWVDQGRLRRVGRENDGIFTVNR